MCVLCHAAKVKAVGSAVVACGIKPQGAACEGQTQDPCQSEASALHGHLAVLVTASRPPTCCTHMSCVFEPSSYLEFEDPLPPRQYDPSATTSCR